MRRREFSSGATAAAALALLAIAKDAQKPVSGAVADSASRAGAGSAQQSGTAGRGVAMGTNLSGMEWARPGLRYGSGTAPNLNFTVPRKAEVSYMAQSGYTKNRLPIQWELLQPMLHDTQANAAAVSLIGKPGEFHAEYAAYITGVLDAHAAVGMTCIIDCHNYCRYQDFKFQPDGSVIGLGKAFDPALRPYTRDSSQVQVRIFALAPGATLKVSNFADFWTRAASRWKNHPGLGGYGLMNEPHELPRPGSIEASSGGGEDLMILPAYAQAAINAIRAVDRATPVYLGGNAWSSAMSIGTLNPAWPLPENNLIYEVHLYLDAGNTGGAFDYKTEVAKRFSAGLGAVPIHLDTGVERLKIATDWARAKGVKLALTEVGMPIDDPQWEEAFQRVARHARQTQCEIYTWMGGSHWPIRNYAINHVPGWHQNKTLEPAVSGPLKAAAGIAQATLFDDGPGWAPEGKPVTITVYARGHLARPVFIKVAASQGGFLSKQQLMIPAGANGQDTFSCTPKSNAVTTLTYRSDAAFKGPLPPPRKVYSLADPAAYAATSLSDAALAIMARYSACQWLLADGYTDYVQGSLAMAGQPVRAISDSGYGSSPGNAMEMLNWINKDSSAMGAMALPLMRSTQGKKNSDHRAPDTFGFWCKKTASVPGIQPDPVNRVPYAIEDAHFALAAVSIPGLRNTGVMFQASQAEKRHCSELAFMDSRPQARWTDARGQKVELTSPLPLQANEPGVIAFTCAPGKQTLRVNSAEVASSAATLAPSQYNQLLIGWGFLDYYPNASFGGYVYAVVTGKGAPRPEELQLLERYLGFVAGKT